MKASHIVLATAVVAAALAAFGRHHRNREAGSREFFRRHGAEVR